MPLTMADATFIIPVFNQLHYTRNCLESFSTDGIADARIVIVDNGSTDGTREFLAGRPGLRAISNAKNLGCSAAWNQGLQEAGTATWKIIINNDVVVAPRFLEGLIGFATADGRDIVSPAMTEGELDYDFGKFSTEFLAKMGAACRSGTASGVCFMVHRRVFETIGAFDTNLGQAGYEDEDFFRRARAAGFRLGITGRAYLHHFGSVTQKKLKSELGMASSAPLGNRDYFRQKHGLNWLKRRTDRFRERTRTRLWQWREQRQTGLALHLLRSEGKWTPA
jgi:GT2 family glycosyltransferase